MIMIIMMAMVMMVVMVMVGQHHLWQPTC
jgi:hypothetical protein